MRYLRDLLYFYLLSLLSCDQIPFDPYQCQEIPRYTFPYIDDVPIRGLETRYELPDSSVETLEQNLGIQKSIFEHLETLIEFYRE